MTEAIPLHLPVMLNESLKGLQVKEDGCYLDATFGRGGHSKAILSQLGPNGLLWVMDRDKEAIDVARDMAAKDSRIRVLAGSFSQADDILGPFVKKFDGILCDLGVSSPQIDVASRGFSFQKDGPLDMRMDNTRGVSAAKWLSRASVDEIEYVLSNFGQERFADIIAKKIVEKRELAPIETTRQLVDIVLSCVPSYKKSHHPATKVFQAIRMHINEELQEIICGLPQLISHLNLSGRLVVLSYHSLEHKAVVQVVKNRIGKERMSLGRPMFKRIGSALKPSFEQVRDNPRARSVLLRIWENVNG